MREPAYPLLRLVTSPDPAADVRFDFNDGTTWAVAGLDMGTPTLLGDADAVGAEYDYRRPAFRVNITGPELEVYARCQALAQAMMRGDNYLFFQHSAITPPVWLELLRSNPGSVTPRRVHRDRDENTWALDLALTAEPFALGAQESFSLTITNDPATGGLAATLPEIKGDAPAPLVVAMDAGTSAYIQPTLAVMPLDTEWPGVVFLQAESMTLLDDSTLTSGAAYSGGSAITFAPSGSDWTRKVEGQLSVPFAGRWRLFARAAITGLGPSGTFPVSFSVRGAGAACVEPVVTEFANSGYQYVELGVYAFPKGNPPLSRPYVIGSDEVAVETKSASGTPIAGLDLIVAIPADLPLDQAAPATTLDFLSAGTTPGSSVLYINGEHGQIEVLDDGVNTPNPATALSGAFLRAAPGATNVMHLLPRRQGSSQEQADDINASTTLTVTYRPRHVYLAGS